VAKYNGPVCRLCRREGQKLFIKGERCYTDKCAFDRHGVPPGMHGAKRGKLSEFGVQLREKQKVKRAYGILEQPFRNIFKKASRERGVTSEIFFKKLEMRLDNVIFRMGFARSRQEAKQVIRHNHIVVNGKRVNIPSVLTEVGDIVSLKEKSQTVALFDSAKALYAKRPALAWIEVDHAKNIGKIVAEPTRDDIGMAVKESLIVELYNK